MAVEVVVDAKYPQGFEGSVAFVHDVPVMSQLTGCADTFWKSSAKLIGRFNPAAPMGLYPLLVPVTVMEAQFTAHGPPPPFAHPTSHTRLPRAAAKSSFFIMIEVFCVIRRTPGEPAGTLLRLSGNVLSGAV